MRPSMLGQRTSATNSPIKNMIKKPSKVEPSDRNNLKELINR